VKALPRCAGREPGGGEAQEGRGSKKGLNNPDRHRTHRGEQGPEARGGEAGAGNRRLTRSRTRGHESAGESRYGSAERDKPLEGKPWTWQRGETNPQRLVAEQAVEDVRNVEDGT